MKHLIFQVFVSAFDLETYQKGCNAMSELQDGVEPEYSSRGIVVNVSAVHE